MSNPVSKLESNAIGLREVVFQSICSMAPGAAIAASIPFGSPLAGGALPLAVLFAFIGILFTASSIGQLAKHIPAAGSVATYSAIGHRPTCYVATWLHSCRRMEFTEQNFPNRFMVDIYDTRNTFSLLVGLSRS